MVVSRLDPGHCTCREKPLTELVAAYSARTRPRVQDAVASPSGIDVRKVRHESQLLVSLSKGGVTPFQPRNLSYGHLCPDCPYRAEHPDVVSLAVDPKPGDG